MRSLCTTVAVLLVVTSANMDLRMGAPRLRSAQAAPAQNAFAGTNAQSSGDHRTQDQLRKEVVDRLHAMRDLRIVQALTLDQAASARLLPVLASYDEREMALATERREVVRSLRAEVKMTPPDDARIRAGIDRLLANRARRQALAEARIADLRKLLTPVDQVKLLLLLPKIDRELSERVRDVARE